MPEHYPRVTAQELESWRGLAYPDLAFAIIEKFVDDIPATELRALIQRAYTPEIFCNTDSGRAHEITPLKTLEPGLHILELSNGPTLAFKDIAMQLLGNLFEYALARSRQRAQHPRRDLGRYRLGGRIRDARQARHPRLHALAAGQDEPVPDRADVFAAGSEYLQHRGPRRVRRLPGHRQGGQQRPGIQDALPDRHRQFDQLGAAGRAGRLLLQGLLRRDAVNAPRRSATRSRPETSAMSAPGMWRG